MLIGTFIIVWAVVTTVFRLAFKQATWGQTFWWTLGISTAFAFSFASSWR